VDSGSICGKCRGLLQKGQRFSGLDLFSNRKCGGLSPWLVHQRSAWSVVNQSPWPAMELIGAQRSGRLGPRWLVARWG
jgi:hypothetical protein